MLEALGVEWIQPDQLSSVTDSSKVSPVSTNVAEGRYTAACFLHLLTWLDSTTTPIIERITTPTLRSTIVPSLKRYSKHTWIFKIADDQIAPHLTGLINGVGWQSGFPRTMTQRDIDGLLASSDGELRLAAIQDVSCDMKVSYRYDWANGKGGLEFVDRHTTIDQPYFEGPGGMLISTTDILPTELRKLPFQHSSKADRKQSTPRTISRIVSCPTLRGSSLAVIRATRLMKRWKEPRSSMEVSLPASIHGSLRGLRGGETPRLVVVAQHAHPPIRLELSAQVS